MLWNLIGIFFGIGTIYFAFFDGTPSTNFEIVMSYAFIMLWIVGWYAITMEDNIGVKE